MEVSRNDLQTDEERNLLAIWEDLFASPGWALVVQRFEPRLAGTVSEMENAEDMKALGRARGVRDTLIELLHLDEMVESEFVSVIAASRAEQQDNDESRGAMA